MIKDELIITMKNANLYNIEHVEDYDVDYIVADREELRKMLHSEVDGISTQLWSDNDYEEPSTIMYLATFLDGSYTVIDDIQALINAINISDPNRIFEVNIEDGLL